MTLPPCRIALGLLLVAVLLPGCAGSRGLSATGVPEPAGEPAPALVFAHRGASGYLPEHTLAAYALAHAQGADFIEPDVVLTKDGVPICSHDLTANATTDVAAVFPGRARADGKWHFADLTLAEVKRLAKLGRRDGYGQQPGHTIPTLEEMLTLVGELNARTGRRAGVVPEAKDPAAHRAAGLDLERALLAALERRGYAAPTAAAVVQSFDLASLRRMRGELRTQLPLVWLIHEGPVDDAQLAAAAGVVSGIGLNRALIESVDERGAHATSDLVSRIRSRGLSVYVYTLKNEPDAIRRFSRQHRVTGLFADFPDVAVQAR